MHTQRLELEDSYIRSWETEVWKIGSHQVGLARSAFYPGGGGQDPDTGTIRWGSAQYQVKSVQKNDDIVTVELDQAVPAVHGSVEAALEWKPRYVNMRTHTAFHCLVGIAWEEFGVKVAGGDMRNGTGRIDFGPGLDREKVFRCVELANDLIAHGAPVRVSEVPQETIDHDPSLVKLVSNRAPVSAQGTYRVVEIVGVDREIDGGTHVADLSEVRGVGVVKYSSSGKGQKRLKFQILD
ncbi:alanyl-tRNA editing protein [Kocuria sp. CPCC 205268]|uniref:alanyl-tRNA editing protein n=1 Tax=Kocuria oxytropis TaxID=3058913 RepID=UPI0034D46CD8